MNQATTKSGGEARFLVSLGTSSAIPRILPGKYGGRELEGGGNSPSPYSSPLKGEEIIPRLPRFARNLRGELLNNLVN